MIEQLIYLVEETGWNEWLRRQERALKGFCWGMITAAIIYFGPALIGIFIS